MGYKAGVGDAASGYRMGFGVASIATAGLASIFRDPATVGGLAGASAIFGGSRATIDEALFQEATLDVIFGGIDIARDRAFARIIEERYYFERRENEGSDEATGASADAALGDAFAAPFTDPIARAWRAYAAGEASPNSVEAAIAADIARLVGVRRSFGTLDKVVLASEGDRRRGLVTLDNARRQNLQLTSVVTYTLESAITDALRVHAACSLPAGLDAASEAVSESRELTRSGLDGRTRGALIDAVIGQTAIEPRR